MYYFCRFLFINQEPGINIISEEVKLSVTKLNFFDNSLGWVRQIVHMEFSAELKAALVSQLQALVITVLNSQRHQPGAMHMPTAIYSIDIRAGVIYGVD